MATMDQLKNHYANLASQIAQAVPVKPLALPVSTATNATISLVSHLALQTLTRKLGTALTVIKHV